MDRVGFDEDRVLVRRPQSLLLDSKLGGHGDALFSPSMAAADMAQSTAYVLLFILGNATSFVFIWLFGCVQGLFSTQTFGNQSTQILFL